jgi:hypothetical protein
LSLRNSELKTLLTASEGNHFTPKLIACSGILAFYLDIIRGMGDLSITCRFTPRLVREDLWRLIDITVYGSCFCFFY